MKKIILETKNNIQKNYLNKFSLKKISKNYQKENKEIYNDIYNINKTLNILSERYKFNFKIKDLKRFKKFQTVAIIGMGGSILGAEALYNFLETKIKKKFYFFNDLDPKQNIFFRKKKNFKKILFIIISKSGTTVETISNFFGLKILEKYSKNIIIISEKKHNPLYEISKKLNLFFIEHKKSIGGRYSVLSEVGIVPAYFMGLNIAKLRSNAQSFLNGRKNIFLKDSVIKLSCLLKDKKIKNIVFINYAPELQKFLYWCQQLIAESLGKKDMGFFPTISIAPKDHHSLLQLYLDGPKDKLFHIFSINSKLKEKIYINKFFNKNLFLNRKKLSSIKVAQKDALIKTLKNKNIPFREFTLKTNDEVIIGELFSYFILETILIGKLNNINPFDQPAVEQVKNLTKKLLK